MYHLSLFNNDRELGVAYTSVASVTAISQVIGGPLAAVLLLLDGTWGLAGWQWLFVLEGLPTIGLGVFLGVSISWSLIHLHSEVECWWGCVLSSDCAIVGLIVLGPGRPRVRQCMGVSCTFLLQKSKLTRRGETGKIFLGDDLIRAGLDPMEHTRH